MSINQVAVHFLESNQFMRAKNTFIKAIERSRDVQSLHNLANYYATEEDDFEQAILLLQEAIALNPPHYFPFALLAETYMKQENYEQALPLYQHIFTMEDNPVIRHNLAYCLYKKEAYDEAFKLLFSISKKEENVTLFLILCQLKAKRFEEGKLVLEAYAKKQVESNEFLFDALPIAEAYLEVKAYEEAVFWYEKAMDTWSYDPKWIIGFIYTLKKLGREQEASIILQGEVTRTIADIEELVNETVFDAYNTKEDNEYMLEKYLKEKAAYETMQAKVEKGFTPQYEYDPSYVVACYLYGCTRHGHPSYDETKE